MTTEHKPHSVPAAINDLRTGIDGFVPHPNDRIMREALASLEEEIGELARQVAAGGQAMIELARIEEQYAELARRAHETELSDEDFREWVMEKFGG